MKIQRWIDALRSGKYKQGMRALKSGTVDDPKFCCLGVACDIFQDDIGWEWKGVSYCELAGDGDLVTAGLPFPLATMLENEIGYLNEARLIAMNDREDQTFDQIADYLEAHSAYEH